MTGKFLPNYVEAVFASRRLPPKAAVSACSRHSFVEGIMNGGLDVTQNRRSTLKIHYGRTKLPALQRFFLSPSGGAGSLGLFGLFLLLCGCLFQPRKALIADDVFNPAGVGLRSFWVNACGDDKLLGKKAMALVDFFGNLAAQIGQMEKVIFVHCKKVAVP